jgi:nucleoid-associated protein YgaU
MKISKKTLQKIIAEEAVKAIMEEKSCAEERLADLEYLKDVFKQLCAAFERFGIKREEAIKSEEEVEQPEAEISATQDVEPQSRTGSSANVHTVVKGDTFWELSRKYLGDPRKWKQIQRANLRNGKPIPPRRLPIGTKLRIPN